MPTRSTILITIIISIFCTLLTMMFWWGKQNEARLTILEDKISEEQNKTRLAYYQTTVNDTCGEECKKAIQQIFDENPVQSNPTLPKKPTPVVSYLTLSTPGTIANRDWTDLPGSDFSFDKSNYPLLTSSAFEATLSVKDANGSAFARLFDVTHGIAVQGSELETISDTPKLIESSNLNFFSGKNVYRVQLKSLTGYEVKFWGGRIRLHVN